MASHASPDEYAIVEWTPARPRWSEVLDVVAEMGQTAWVDFHAPFHQSDHMLVALWEDVVAGFLRFVTQEIGPDAGCPPVRLNDQPLTEAKVLAFGVPSVYRRRGIGRALQVATIARARALGCHQVRSHSSGTNEANHQLKLALGFGAHPVTRGDDHAGVYFILPLPRPDV